VVPLLNSQMVHFNLEREAKNISEKVIEKNIEKNIENLEKDQADSKPEHLSEENDNFFTTLLQSFFKK
jgi:hypothetical protein